MKNTLSNNDNNTTTSIEDLIRKCWTDENQSFSYADFGIRLEEATNGYIRRIESLIVSKDETAVNCVADMLKSNGFDAVTGYFDPVEDKRNNTVGPLTGYYYVAI